MKGDKRCKLPKFWKLRKFGLTPLCVIPRRVHTKAPCPGDQDGIGNYSPELPLYERLEALVNTLLPGDILYLTIPRPMAGNAITSWLLAHFACIGPLNVGTNPQLRNNDPRTRAGFMGVK
jgi:hypothetical protein